MSLIHTLDLCAVAVCAITATLEAHRRDLDLFGVAVIAVIAGIGGGTVRDVLLGRLPVYWVHDPIYVMVGIAAAVATFFLGRRFAIPKNFFLLPDALGLALFTVIGTTVALNLQVHWFIAALMGVITGVFGGVIRDILCNEVPLIFRTDIYATASLVGALLLILLDTLGLERLPSILFAMLVTVSLRLAAIRWHIHLPRLRPPLMIDPTLPAWLVYCRPGFERDCIEETQAKPVEADENSGYLVLQGKAKLTYKQLAFARQLLRLHCEVSDLPERDRLTPLLEALPQTPERFGALYLEVPDTNDGKTLSGFTKRFQPLIEQALRDSERLVDDPALPRLHIFFPSEDRALIASSDPRNSNDAPNGIHRVSMSADAPSRSYLKLAEAFEVFLDKQEQAQWLKPKMTAVDLGAAPGGWTWQLAQRGLKVTAVDNGPLKGAAASHPDIKHLRQDGFKFRPQRPVDWLVCDMVEQPQRVAALMTEWIVGGLSMNAIFDLKLPMKKRVEALRIALDSIRSALNKKGLRYRLEAKQLYHDREEVTVFLHREKR